MKRGGFAFVACSSLAISACAAPSVQVRALPDPAAKLRQGGDELANARSMLALGNAGLALEGFRKLRITQATNPDVYTGIADCYAAMGRYDLARTNYETALAYAPHDPALLAALAKALDNQGETARALAVRAELALLTSASEPKPQQAIAVAVAASTEPPTPNLAPQLGSITVKLPPARPITSSAVNQSLQGSVTPIAVSEPSEAQIPQAQHRELADAALPPPVASKANVGDAGAPPIALKHSTAAVAVDLGATHAAVAQTVLTMPLAPVAALELAQVKMAAAVEATPLSRPMPPRTPVPAAVTLVERPRRPSPSLPSASELVAQLIAMDPAIKPRDPDLRAQEEANSSAPRLERISLGEVALVTTPAPLWQAKVATAGPVRAAVQWLPIQSADARPPIQLLNAARTQGLAAWTRMALVNRGWRRIDIGDYGEVRQRSLVLYSGDHAPLARRVAAQFGCKAVKVDGKSGVVVLLGRDAASRKASTLRA